MLTKLILPALCAGLAVAFPNQRAARSPCPPVTGDFNITYFRLYSESFDYDTINCHAWFGGNFNATALRVDLKTGAQKLITFPGLTGNTTFHISGVQFNAAEGAMYFSGNNGVAFESQGKSLEGPNRLIKYDTTREKIIWYSDIDPVVAEIKNVSGHQINGFQDSAQDLAGNSYYVAAFGNAIVRVSPRGVPSIFYYTPQPTAAANGGWAIGWNGIFAVGNKLILADAISGAFWTFDATQKVGVPVSFKPSGTPSGFYFGCDRNYAPPMFNNQLLLCANDFSGVDVYYSANGWSSAKYLGLIPKNANDSGIPTSVAQIAGSIYVNSEYFFDLGAFDIQPGGNRSVFPFYDITAPAKALYAAAKA